MDEMGLRRRPSARAAEIEHPQAAVGGQEPGVGEQDIRPASTEERVRRLQAAVDAALERSDELPASLRLALHALNEEILWFESTA